MFFYNPFYFFVVDAKVDYFFLAGNQYGYGRLDAAKPDTCGFLHDDVLELFGFFTRFLRRQFLVKSLKDFVCAGSDTATPQVYLYLGLCIQCGLFRFRRLKNTIQFSYRFQLFYH